MRSLAPAWKKNPQLVIWVSWYKKSSGIATDLTEDLIRDYALEQRVGRYQGMRRQRRMERTEIGGAVKQTMILNVSVICCF